VGAVTAGVDAFASGQGTNVAARYAQAVHGYKRIAIVDFDLHHGNGTQAEVQSDPTHF
jgi:acetoin utilization deacetylase AcuC-like enzyme